MNLGLHSNPTFPLELPEVLAWYHMSMDSKSYSRDQVREIVQAMRAALGRYRASDWKMVVHVPHGHFYRVQHYSIEQLFASD